jgi:hypothetical protein
MPSLADTTVLNNFAQIRRTDLLRSIYPDLSAPLPVWSELEIGVRRGLVPACDWSWLKILDLTEPERLGPPRSAVTWEPAKLPAFRQPFFAGSSFSLTTGKRERSAAHWDSRFRAPWAFLTAWS